MSSKTRRPRLRLRPRPRLESNDEEESSDEDERTLFYIPGQGINPEVLNFYLRKFLGEDSDVEPGKHPQVRSTCANKFGSIDNEQKSAQIGYYVRSRSGLTAVGPCDKAVRKADDH
jgi:hypothetical protein